MKKRLLISLLSILGVSSCTLEDATERGFDCPPRLFAYDVDGDGQEIAEPYLCMIESIRDNSVSDCIPCDFGMNKITDENYVYLDQNKAGNYIYKNKDDSEVIESRKYLDESSSEYIINRYSDYKSYAESHERVELYAISGLCTRTDLERYDECNTICGEDIDECSDESCKDIIERVSKCLKLENYKKFFDSDFCPGAYPVCLFGPYDASGSHFYCSSYLKAECTPETASVDCELKISHWVSGKCKDNTCHVESCSDGFQPSKDGKSCVADCTVGQHYDNSAQECVEDDIFNCGVTGYVCSENVDQWADGACLSGVCMISNCQPGYKIVNNTCKSDCASGEHYDSSQAKCVADDIDNCGAPGLACKDVIKNSANVTCEEGKCIVSECNDGYTVSDNNCTSNCTDTEYYDSSTASCKSSSETDCGMKGYSCSEKVAQWLSGTCYNNICTLSACNEGYKVVDNACKPDCTANQHYNTSLAKCEDNDINNCGAVGYSCSERIAQWSKGSCVSGVCSLTECESGYKIVNNTCKSDCKSGEHYDSEQAKCVTDDIDNCGATGHVCKDEIKNSESVQCTSGKCVVDKCNSGYTVNNNTCTSSCSNSEYYDSSTGQCAASDVDNCGQKGYKCNDKTTLWADGSCTNNVCTLSACQQGYKVVSNICKPDCGSEQHYNTSTAQCEDNNVNNCGAVGYKCSERVAQWVNGSCVSGICTLSACESGYKIVDNTCKSDCKANEHYNSEQAKCVDDDVDNCGATGRSCKDEIKNSKSVACMAGKCLVSECNSGYNVINNVCTSSCSISEYYDSLTGACSTSDINNCGQKGYQCSSHISNWKTGNCLSNVCVLSSCRDGFTIINNECKADCGTTMYYDSTTGSCMPSDVNNCGQKGFKCSDQVSNWSNGTCSNNVCLLTECATGYKPSANGKQCVSNCTTGQHYDNESSQCVDDDINNCGATGRVCTDEIKNSSQVKCEAGKCIVTECNSGYTVNNNVCTSSCSTLQYYDSETGKCESSDVDNCGQKGYKCSNHISNWKSGTCTNNACVVNICSDNYAVVNNECRADCGSTNYYDSTTGECAVSDINNCGQKNYKCASQVSNWNKGTCSNNVCILTECATGFKPSSDNKQCVSDCKTGQHYDSEEAQCVADNVDNCGATGHKCKDEIKNSNVVNCDAGKCIVSECNSGYSVNNNVCTSSCSGKQYYDSTTGACAYSDANNCGQKGYKCSEHISNWKTGNCTDNACVVSTCTEGFSAVNNECKADCGTTKFYDSATGTCVASDVNNCGQKGYQCPSHISNWENGVCSNNVCTVTECATGYKPSADGKQCVSNCTPGQHYDSTVAQCVADDNDNCGATGHKCLDEIKNSKTVSCNNGKCVVSVCNSGYNVINNVCTSSCNESQYYDSSTGKCTTSNTDNCGQKGYKCAEHISNWETGKCNNNACIVEVCASGFAPINNECKADCGTTKYYDSATGTCVASDNNNCGMKGYKCSSMISNWNNGNCTNNICVVSACATGYKPSTDGKQCVSDCQAGQHYDSSQAKCVNDDNDNCGATGHACRDEIKNSRTTHCNSGRCYVDECNSGYTASNNVCVSSCNNSQYYDSTSGGCKNSDKENCGQKGYKCADRVSNWKTGKCTNNACIVESCNEGYAVVGSECKADCGMTKYYDSSTGACVDSDINNCGQKNYKCSVQVSNWKDGSCVNNACYVSICSSGYKPSQDSKSCASDCQENEYYNSSTSSCAPSDLDNCGQKGYKCSEHILNWKTGKCLDNVCTVETCNPGYNAKNNVCVSNCSNTTQYYDSSTGQCATSNANNCGQKGYKCSEHISNWKNGNCNNNACTVTACNTGYTVVNNECKADCGTTKYYDSAKGDCVDSDANNCGQKGYKCAAQISNWSEGDCYNNLCVVTKCQKGFKPSGDNKQCVSDCSTTEYYDSTAATCIESNTNNCGQKEYKCSEHILNWATGSCTNNTCVVATCNSGYNVNNNVCTSTCSGNEYYDSSTGKCKTSDLNNCGQKGYKCSQHIPNWKSGNCSNNVCLVTECNANYTPLNNECKADCGTDKYYDSAKGDCVDSDIDNCGQKEYKCAAHISNWTNGNCEENACIVTNCDTGYKPSSDGKQCISSCSSGEHYDSSKGKCVKDDNNNCGATGHSCKDEIKNSYTVHCTGGKCYVDKCNSGYIPNNNVCTSSCSSSEYYDNLTGTCQKSDENNCGMAGKSCQELAGWIKGSCQNNECIAQICETNYHEFKGKCIADTQTCCGDSCEDCNKSELICTEGRCQCAPYQVLCKDACINKSQLDIFHVTPIKEPECECMKGWENADKTWANGCEKET